MAKETTIKRAICTFCSRNCGVLVHVRDNRVIKVEGNKDHPISKGFICTRSKFAPKWLYHPDQLQYPLKRVGERGENKWERVTWDSALDEVAEKLQTLKNKYGPETLFMVEGTMRGALFWMRSRFNYLFGNPQNCAHPGIICGLNHHAMGQTIGGWRITTKDGNLEHIQATNCIVTWGCSVNQSLLREAGWIKQERRKRKLRLIVVDPMVTEIAEVADFHLQLRPGTDGALALGWINVIINEKLYDRDFVEKWTVGFDKLALRAQEYPPQKVAEITGLTVEQIVNSARMYATTKPAWLCGGLAADEIGLNGTRVAQALKICQTLVNNLDIMGGSPMPSMGPYHNGKLLTRDCQLELRDKMPKELRATQLGSDRFKLMTFPGYELTAPYYEKIYGVPCPSTHRMAISAALAWRAILTRKPYPLTAMICWESNPMLWAGNVKLIYEALKSPNLELSIVNDFWMTPTALLADYVFPVASWLERPYLDTWMDFSDFCVGGERPVEPLGERKEDIYFWGQLGTRLGQGKYWPWNSFEELIRERVGNIGLSYEEFVKLGGLTTPYKEKKYLEQGFPSPSGKLELYSSFLEKLGYDPLPFYEEPAESLVRTPEVAKEYPFILNTGGKFIPMYHSEFRHWGIGSREIHPLPLADINIEDAKELGIKDGDWIFIETRRGKIKQVARVSNKILRGVVNAQSHWWFPEMPAEDPCLHGVWESNANVLTLDEPDACDPLTGGWQNRALLCKIYKA